MFQEFNLAGRVPSKKNSRITQRSTGRSYASKDYQKWHKMAMMQLLCNRVPKAKMKVESVSIHFVFGDQRPCDLTNKAESIMDLMVDYGFLLNDNWQNTGSVYLSAEYKKAVFTQKIRVDY